MPQMPTRVIDCNRLCLIETEQGQTGSGRISAPYSILSHCWGTKTNLKTTSANYEEMCSSIKLEKLPATIRDAILLTRELGLRYIWVDSFCIIQCDSRSVVSQDYSDWTKELPNMHRYYQNATITLVIETAIGDHEGFLEQLDLQSKRSTSEHPRSVPIPVNLETHHAFFQIDHEEDKSATWCYENFFLGSTPLRTRAWTMQ
jgi:hypothetical protein